MDSTNIPTIEKSSTLALPVIHFFLVLCIPLYLPISLCSLSLYRIHHLIRFYASLPICMPTFFVRLAINRQRGKQQILPQIPVRPLPCFRQIRGVLRNRGVHPVVSSVILPILRMRQEHTAKAISLHSWPGRGGRGRADSDSSASGQSSGFDNSSYTPTTLRADRRRALRTSSTHEPSQAKQSLAKQAKTNLDLAFHNSVVFFLFGSGVQTLPRKLPAHKIEKDVAEGF